MKRVTILLAAAALVVATLLHGGLYQIVAAGSGGSGDGYTGDVYAWRLNRLTGGVALCNSQGICVHARLVRSANLERAADRVNDQR